MKQAQVKNTDWKPRNIEQSALPLEQVGSILLRLRDHESEVLTLYVINKTLGIRRGDHTRFSPWKTGREDNSRSWVDPQRIKNVM